MIWKHDETNLPKQEDNKPLKLLKNILFSVDNTMIKFLMA